VAVELAGVALPLFLFPAFPLLSLSLSEIRAGADLDLEAG
jgi:hypothetical protein